MCCVRRRCRVSYWWAIPDLQSGQRKWTQEWCFVPVRQSVESKPLAARLRRKDEYDYHPSDYRTLCGNRCRQARASCGSGNGSGGQRSGDHNSVVRNDGASVTGVASVLTRGRLHQRCPGEHGMVLVPVKNILEEQCKITLVCARNTGRRKETKPIFRTPLIWPSIIGMACSREVTCRSGHRGAS